tara:strand:+ start:16958 stop:17428 length:471 start_codon:yes stop_codon:yes gene_type:complete
VRKGQITGNVFTYIFAIIIIALILLLGYKYIFETKENIQETELILFKNKLTSDIEAISSDFGSSKTVSYSLQAELCLFDLENKEDIIFPDDFNPLIKDSINSNIKKNAFVFSNSIFQSYYIGDIEIEEQNFKCFKPSAGKITFTIEGTGNKALINS